MKKEWDIFDRPTTKKILWRVYIGTLLLLLVLNLFIHIHGYFSFDGLYGFYAIYGFVGCVILVVIAKYMRPLVKREEDYYE